MRYLVFVACVFAALVVFVEMRKDREPAETAPPAAFQKLDYETALDKARREKKVVMIDFSAKWCGPCRKLDKETFAEEKVQQFLINKTVAIKIDIDDNRKLAGNYQVSSIPCVVFIDGRGGEIGRLVGFRPAAAFLEEAGSFVK
jgi:thioredoxin 1